MCGGVRSFRLFSAAARSPAPGGVMALDPASVIDRRRLKRRLNFWRIAAVAAAAAGLLAAVSRFDDTGLSDHVARLDVAGIILDDPARDEALRGVLERGSVKALIVAIDSPGGTFVGGEALFEHLRAVAAEKPVVAVLGGTATSAAYMAAIGADHIVARNGTLTGSIGVIMQTADITGLLEKLGIKPETVKSGPLKAQPNPMEPFSPAAREAARAVIADLFGRFVDMVAARRGLDRNVVMDLADGRVYSGRQALDAGLVDMIGGEAEAHRWLAEKRGIDRDLPTRELEIQDDEEIWRRLMDAMVGKTLFSERLRLDGVLSVWQPDLH